MDKKSKKGGPNPGVPTMEDKRNTVIEHELNARFWRATYEVMYYTLEAEGIKGQYGELLEKQRLEQEERVKKANEQITNLNNEMKEGGITISELKDQDNGSGQKVELSIDTANVQGS